MSKNEYSKDFENIIEKEYEKYGSLSGLWEDCYNVTDDIWKAVRIVLPGSIPIDPHQPIDPPWPSADFLKRCEEVESGSTEKIFKYAEIFQKRRHEKKMKEWKVGNFFL